MTTSIFSGMTPRDWAFLACRVLALFFLYHAINTLLTFGLYSFAQSADGESTRFHYFYVLNFLLQSAAGLVLWFGASRLVSKMVPLRPNETEEGAPGEWTVAQLLSLAVSVLGLILLLFAVADAAGAVASYVVRDGFHNQDLIEATMVATRLILGIVLVFGGQGIANIIKSARRW